jgi:hypothetical protein
LCDHPAGRGRSFLARASGDGERRGKEENAGEGKAHESSPSVRWLRRALQISFAAVTK